jgi:MFS transporter, putative metabolite:H+ symporter
MSKDHKVLNAAVIVAALGYFVDIYDLILFSIVRVPSLKALGFDGDPLFAKGVLLLNMQMAGMLMGGIFWGILGDKRGRLSVLFGSIILYSLANIANGMVQSIEAYAFLRLVAGIGLAGELGAGITLVSEVLPTHKRGYGTTIVASVGICGALLAAYVAEHFDWRVAYYIGGGLGLLLLILRLSVFESALFQKVKESTTVRGDFLALFRSRERFLKYLHCILIGIPIWFVIGILITFSPEFSKALQATDQIIAGKAVFYAYFGLAAGDLTSGGLSQIIGSRRKILFLYLSITSASVLAYLSLTGLNSTAYYAICWLLGFGAGYWAVFVTLASEQFGTNLRATVTTTVPNFVRGSVVLVTFLFTIAKNGLGIISAGLLVGIASLVIAFFSASRLEETYSRDLNFLEDL